MWVILISFDISVNITLSPHHFITQWIGEYSINELEQQLTHYDNWLNGSTTPLFHVVYTNNYYSNLLTYIYGPKQWCLSLYLFTFNQYQINFEKNSEWKFLHFFWQIYDRISFKMAWRNADQHKLCSSDRLINNLSEFCYKTGTYLNRKWWAKWMEIV